MTQSTLVGATAVHTGTCQIPERCRLHSILATASVLAHSDPPRSQHCEQRAVQDYQIRKAANL